MINKLALKWDVDGQGEVERLGGPLYVAKTNRRHALDRATLVEGSIGGSAPPSLSDSQLTIFRTKP